MHNHLHQANFHTKNYGNMKHKNLITSLDDFICSLTTLNKPTMSSTFITLSHVSPINSLQLSCSPHKITNSFSCKNSTESFTEFYKKFKNLFINKINNTHKTLSSFTDPSALPLHTDCNFINNVF